MRTALLALSFLLSFSESNVGSDPDAGDDAHTDAA